MAIICFTFLDGMASRVNFVESAKSLAIKHRREESAGWRVFTPVEEGRALPTITESFAPIHPTFIKAAIDYLVAQGHRVVILSEDPALKVRDEMPVFLREQIGLENETIEEKLTLLGYCGSVSNKEAKIPGYIGNVLNFLKQQFSGFSNEDVVLIDNDAQRRVEAAAAKCRAIGFTELPDIQNISKQFTNTTITCKEVTIRKQAAAQEVLATHSSAFFPPRDGAEQLLVVRPGIVDQAAQTAKKPAPVRSRKCVIL